MAGIGQYLKDTQGELRHVAWPTQLQTIVYTILVALISIGVALYLGFFDYLFATGLSRVIGAAPAPAQNSGLEIQENSGEEAPQVEFAVPGGEDNAQ